MRMEECVAATAEGRSRKERDSARREEELTKALEAEDKKLQKAKELIDRNARDAAIASFDKRTRHGRAGYGRA